MKLSQIFEDTSFDVEIRGISIDTRKVYHGDLFVCIEGLNVDGHDFAKEAVEKGAVAVLCKPSFKEELGVPKVYFDNTRYALSQACNIFYNNPLKDIICIGVTGTNGKSSTVYFLEEILKGLGKRVGAIGTMGARLDSMPLEIPFVTSTTPDTVELYRILSAMRDTRAQYVVMEVTSHALALEKVSHINFDLGLFTNLSQDHLDFHGTMENYLNAKAKLFDLSKVGIINADDDTRGFLLNYAKCPMILYGTNQDSKYKAKNLQLKSDKVLYEVESIDISVPIPGKFTIYNTLCAYSALRELGFDAVDISNCLYTLEGVAGRIQKIEHNFGFNVIIDYAHTPDGLMNIIDSCREFTKGRIITIFGCGGDRDPIKRPIMGEIAKRLSDYVIITSDNPRNENPSEILDQIEKGMVNNNTIKQVMHTKIVDRKDAIYHAVNMAKADDCIIIAGKGHEDYQEFENKRRIHFDDAAVAKEALKLKG